MKFLVCSKISAARLSLGIMKNTYFSGSLSSSNLLVLGFLICLSSVLPVKAQEFSPLSPAAITYGSQSSASFPAPAFQARIAVADFDADGDADILYQTGNSGTPFRYSRNNGNGTFTDLAHADFPFAGLTLPDNLGSNYYPADYDNDGDVDLWVPANSSTGSYFRNDGNAFSSHYTINPSITLAPGTAYAVLFDPGTFRDADGAIFAGINNISSLNFTTAIVTADSVCLRGRVVTWGNQGISSATVTLINAAGEIRITRTNPFGYYQFEDLEIGIYIVTVKSKGHQFNQNSQVLTILQDEENFNFVGIPVLKAF